MRWSHCLIFVLSFLVMNTASAYLYNQRFGPRTGILIEPVYGFSTGELVSKPSGSKDLWAFTGTGYGGRLGFQYGRIQLGVDYLNSNLTFESKDWEETKLSAWSGFIGLKIPRLWRLYGGYTFSATGEGYYNDQKLIFLEGSGTKFGIGFTGIPFLNINFEYTQGEFGDAKDGGTVLGYGPTYHSYMFTLSIPILI